MNFDWNDAFGQLRTLTQNTALTPEQQRQLDRLLDLARMASRPRFIEEWLPYIRTSALYRSLPSSASPLLPYLQNEQSISFSWDSGFERYLAHKTFQHSNGKTLSKKANLLLSQKLPEIIAQQTHFNRGFCDEYENLYGEGVIELDDSNAPILLYFETYWAQEVETESHDKNDVPDLDDLLQTLEKSDPERYRDYEISETSNTHDLVLYITREQTGDWHKNPHAYVHEHIEDGHTWRYDLNLLLAFGTSIADIGLSAR